MNAGAQAEITSSPAPRNMTSAEICPRKMLSRSEKILVALFLLTLPFANPWVRGDGVGYYAFARSILIGHNLDFHQDWLSANASFRMGRVDEQNQVLATEYTPTGHLNNHFSIGPAILWAPFLLVAHGGVLVSDKLGAHVTANGYSHPYLWAMAIGTAVYGFWALWISFKIASKYFSEKWAFLATLGIWFASSLSVYMYFNPSWSHAQSAFTVALFAWYWDRTQEQRSWKQWALLGLIGGLMMDVYYITAIVLLLPLLDLAAQPRAVQARRPSTRTLFLSLGLFSTAVLAAFLPTLITKKIIYGSFLLFGYQTLWYWRSPALLKVLFSPDHGLLSWTPILALAVAGLLFVWRKDARLGTSLLAVFAIYLYALGCYQDWAGISSFGNRFFVSLTPFFVLGLAALFQWLASIWTERKAWACSAVLTAALVAWNCGMIFQWGTHLIPVRGPISWRTAATNQVTLVPVEAAQALDVYMTRRTKLMEKIERIDVNQLRTAESSSE